jgi:hypothetical protein
MIPDKNAGPVAVGIPSTLDRYPSVRLTYINNISLIKGNNVRQIAAHAPSPGLYTSMPGERRLQAGWSGPTAGSSGGQGHSN